MEETVLCLVPPYPLTAPSSPLHPKKKKKCPLCFESKEGCSHVLLIYTRKATGRTVG